MINSNLYQFATVRQLEYLEAADKYGSNAQAAAALGVDRRVVDRSIQALKFKATNAGVLTPVKTGAGKSTQPLKIMVLPDVQAKPGTDFTYLNRAGHYMIEKRPDVVVCIGDFADMASLSSYDKGKKSFEGRRYKRDILAAHEAMRALMGPLADYNAGLFAKGRKPYQPRLEMFLGNHEDRINRVINDDPKLDGVMSVSDLEYEDFGWTVTPFLEVKVIEGVAFSHYFTTGVMGRPASTAAAQLRKTNMSCVAGHQQGKQIAYATRADGSTITSLICGSFYEHTEDYMGPQGNKHWRGFVMLHEVNDGAFDEMCVSLPYLNGKYKPTPGTPWIDVMPEAA